MMSADPATESAVVEAVRVIVEPDGARSGTFSQATVRSESEKSSPRTASKRIRWVRRAMIKLVNILIPMHLGGQAAERQFHGRGPTEPARALGDRSVRAPAASVDARKGPACPPSSRTRSAAPRSHDSRRAGEQGYAMAVLLVALSVMAI